MSDMQNMTAADALIKAIRADYAAAMNSDSTRFGKLLRRILDGRGTLSDVSRLATECGQELSEIIAKHITPELQSKMTYDIAREVLGTTLRDNYDLINIAAQTVQEDADKSQDIRIEPRKAPFPETRVDHIAYSVVDTTAAEKTLRRRLDSPVRNVTDSFYTDYVEENAKFRSDAGLKSVVIRETSGKCCEWCSSIAGRYEYPGVPAEIWGFHDNCTCSVTYTSEKTASIHSRKNRRGRRLEGKERDEVLARVKKPTVLTKIEAEKLQNRVLNEVGFYVDNNNQVQNYKPVVINHNDYISTDRNGNNVSFYKANNAVNEIYISDSVKLKRKEFHNFDKSITETYKLLNSSNEYKKPQICIMSPKEMNTSAIGSFSPKLNMLFINSVFFDTEEISKIQADFACPDNPTSTLVHELIHWQDAEEYKKKHGEITDYDEYIRFLNKKFAPKLEILQENGYNIDSISPYAYKSFLQGRFDEVYTEYRVKQLLKR